MAGNSDVAYSYIRFSCMAQEEGDSVRRQMALAVEWATRHKIPLDTSLKVDRGLSGYTSENLDRGALGQFVALVRSRTVRPGSYLVVEALDRLTRAKPQAALRLILELTGAGIRVVQLRPEEVTYDNDSDEWDLMRMLMHFTRGHGESKRKSGMIREQRAKAREDVRKGGALAQRHPAWLRREGDQWVVLPDRAAALRRMYDMAATGHGTPAIAAALNADNVPTWGGADRWSYGTIHAILRDGRAAGALQPRGPGRVADGPPILTYYPAVVSPARAAAALAGLTQRRRKPGRTGAVVNVFSGILWDAGGGGGPMSLVKQHVPGGAYWCLSRDPQQPSDTARVTMPYNAFETAILSRLAELPDSDVAGDDGVSDLGNAERRLADLRQGQAELILALSRRPSPTLLAAAERVDADLSAAERETAELRIRVATPAVDELARTKDVIGRLATAEDPRAERLALRASLRSVVSAIHVVIVVRGISRVAAVQVRLPAGRVRDYLIVYRRAVGNRTGSKQPARMGVWSLPRDPGDDVALDFTRADHVERMQCHLSGLALEGLTLADVS